MMINDKELISCALQFLKNAQLDDMILFKTFKEDRSICLRVCEDACYEVCEQGYENTVVTTDSQKELKKILKTAHKREFPRSHKIKVSQRKYIQG